MDNLTAFRNRIHDQFSSSAPELSFELALDIPESLSAGAKFRLKDFSP